MKITIEDLKNLIQEELNKSSDKDSFIHKPSHSEEIIDLKSSLEESFDVINDQNFIKDSEEKIEELKNLNEEIKRMKQLVDFRSPLLSNESL